MHPTRKKILQAGLKMASLKGISGVTIGTIAALTKLSKSGLFSHFQSKEDMQAEILGAAESLFAHEVLGQLQAPRGLLRLRLLFLRWLGWAPRAGLPGGCVFVHAAAEIHALSGVARKRAVEVQHRWLTHLSHEVQIAIDAGELRKDAKPQQIAFELLGIYLAHHWNEQLRTIDRADERAMEAYDRLIGNFATTKKVRKERLKIESKKDRRGARMSANALYS